MRETTKDQRWHIADVLRMERLDKVNQMHPPVSVKNTFYVKYGKRMLDIAIALPAFAVSLPINLVIGVVTYFDVGKPIFFRQERVGKDGKLFTIIKFRNMKELFDEQGNLLPASQRVTKFGKFVRKTSIDELLNFWSVLKGDMSIIGPRPLVPEYEKRYSARHWQRLCVRPGLECPPREKMDHYWSWDEQFENDVWYVENISFLTDCKMIWNLVRFTLDRKSASSRANVHRIAFIGYSKDGKAIDAADLTDEEIDNALAAAVQ